MNTPGWVSSIGLLIALSAQSHGQTYHRIAFQSARDSADPYEFGEAWNWEIYSMNTDGSDQVNLTNRQSREIDPAWSPDGTKIAFASDRTGSFQIYVMDPDGRNQAQLTHGPGDHVWPAWSPDGSQLAYSADEQRGDFDIYVMQADGQDAVNITESPGTDYAPSWSPGGERIAFASDRDRPARSSAYGQLDNGHTLWMNASDILSVDALGGMATNLTSTAQTARNADPAWSPLGGAIAFVGESYTEAPLSFFEDVMLVSAGGGGLQRLALPGPSNRAAPSWSPDAMFLTYSALLGSPDDSLRSEIYIVPSAGGAPTNLTQSRGADTHPTWSPMLPTTAVEQTTWGAIKSLFRDDPGATQD